LKKGKTTIRKKENRKTRVSSMVKKTHINTHSYTEKHPVQKITHILTSTKVETKE
jgi:hypothetical protein